MNKNKDEIIFGARRAGITWLYSFSDRAQLDSARAGAKRLGSSLSQMLCGPTPRDPENGPLKFTHEDRATHRLKIQITECDEFTRRALERQAVYQGVSVEEYIIDGALCKLASSEETTFLDPETGEVVLSDLELGDYIGCKVDEDAPQPPASNFTRISIPRRAIVETCA